MLVDILLNLFMALGAVTAVGFVAAMWLFLWFETGSDILANARLIIQSRKDKKLFTQIEEFRCDFS